MLRKEIIELIEKIQRSEGSEEEEDNDIEIVCYGVADPQVVDYIFQQDLSAEEIADKILDYKPIQLDGPSGFLP